MKIKILRILLCFISLICVSCNKAGNSDSTDSGSNADSASSTAATLIAAAQVIDLSTLPLIQGSEPPAQQNLANLTYQAKVAIKDAFEFYQKHFKNSGWNELPNSSVTDQYASAVFEKKGFKVSLTAMGSYSNAGATDIILQQHGNINIKKLKLPSGLKPLSEFPLIAIYITDSPVADTVTAIKKSFIDAGWVLYGTAGESLSFKQNAILLNVMISASPAQAGKTTVNISDLLMSADIPAPSEADKIAYAESLQTLSFNTNLTQDQVFDFYRQALSQQGWKQAVDNPSEIEGKLVLTFRNQVQDMINVRIKKGWESAFSVSVDLMTVAQIAEMNRKLDAQAEAYKKKNKLQ